MPYKSSDLKPELVKKPAQPVRKMIPDTFASTHERVEATLAQMKEEEALSKQKV